MRQTHIYGNTPIHRGPNSRVSRPRSIHASPSLSMPYDASCLTTADRRLIDKAVGAIVSGNRADIMTSRGLIRSFLSQPGLLVIEREGMTTACIRLGMVRTVADESRAIVERIQSAVLSMGSTNGILSVSSQPSRVSSACSSPAASSGSAGPSLASTC